MAAARRAGATRVLRCPTRGRGAQLAAGVAAVGVGAGRERGGSSSWSSSSSSSFSSDSAFLPAPRSKKKKKPDTLLFLHADSRLPPNYRASLSRALSSSSSSFSSSSWGAFESVYPTGLWPISSCFLSACVALRTRFLGLPYGDQAIFVKANLLEKVGGIRPLPLMEDVDLVERLSSSSRGGGKEGGGGNKARTFSTKPAIARGCVETSGRRWAERGILKTTLLNLWTLARWKSGRASAEELAREYYRRR